MAKKLLITLFTLILCVSLTLGENGVNIARAFEAAPTEPPPPPDSGGTTGGTGIPGVPTIPGGVIGKVFPIFGGQILTKDGKGIVQLGKKTDDKKNKPYKTPDGKSGKRWQVCLIRVPFFPFVIPYPFLFLQVGPPTPRQLYFLKGLPGLPLPSKLYREGIMEETVWVLGNYFPGLDVAIRKLCWNGKSLPKADGVVWKIGTSCKLKDGIKCRKKGSMPLESLQPLAPTFNAADFPEFCSSSSGAGLCSPTPTTPPATAPPTTSQPPPPPPSSLPP